MRETSGSIAGLIRFPIGLRSHSPVFCLFVRALRQVPPTGRPGPVVVDVCPELMSLLRRGRSLSRVSSPVSLLRVVSVGVSAEPFVWSPCVSLDCGRPVVVDVRSDSGAGGRVGPGLTDEPGRGSEVGFGSSDWRGVGGVSKERHGTVLTVVDHVRGTFVGGVGRLQSCPVLRRDDWRAENEGHTVGE